MPLQLDILRQGSSVSQLPKTQPGASSYSTLGMLGVWLEVGVCYCFYFQLLIVHDTCVLTKSTVSQFLLGETMGTKTKSAPGLALRPSRSLHSWQTLSTTVLGSLHIFPHE